MRPLGIMFFLASIFLLAETPPVNKAPQNIEPHKLSFEQALQAKPPRTPEFKQFEPMLLSEVSILSKPQFTPKLPLLHIANGDNTIIIQIHIDKHGKPVSSKAVKGYFKTTKPFEEYCMNLTFKLVTIDNAPTEATFYMPFRYTQVD